jgi:stage III sporulation protein AD
MELMWKCAALAVSASLLGLAVRREREEQALLLGLAAAVMILASAIGSLKSTEELLRSAGERAGLSPALTLPVLKSLGLALLGRISAGICRDAGQAASASAVELASVCAILCVSLPLLQSLLELVFAYT